MSEDRELKSLRIGLGEKHSLFLFIPTDWDFAIEEDESQSDTLLFFNPNLDEGNLRLTWLDMPGHEPGKRYEPDGDELVVDLDIFQAYFKVAPSEEDESRIMAYWFFELPKMPYLFIASSNLEKAKYLIHGDEAFAVQDMILSEIELPQTDLNFQISDN